MTEPEPEPEQDTEYQGVILLLMYFVLSAIRM